MIGFITDFFRRYFTGMKKVKIFALYCGA